MKTALRIIGNVGALAGILSFLSACGEPPSRSGDAPPDAEVGAAAPTEARHIYKETLLARTESDPLILDLRLRGVWFVEASAMPYLDRAGIICPDGTQLSLSSWVLRQEQNLGIPLRSGFAVSGYEPTVIEDSCETQCHMCPDGAWVCADQCVPFDSGAGAEGPSGHHESSGKKGAPPPEDPTDDDVPSGDGGGDPDDPCGSDGASGSSTGGSTGGGSGSSNSNTSNSNTSSGGASGAGGGVGNGGGGGSGGGRWD